VMSFAVSYFLQHAAIIIFDARPKGVDFLGFLSHSLEVGGLRIPLLQLAIVGTTIVLLTTFSLIYNRTSIGVQMRAAAEDAVMARLVGVPSNRVIAAAFGFAGFLAGVVSLFYVAQRGSVVPGLGLNLVIVAFVSTVIGGMGSIAGAALGGFLVGAVSVGLQAALPVDLRPYRDAFVFAIFLGFLFFRPEGLMARRADRERV
jgi:branched-chain amino acid transport system permease protein